MDARDVIVVGAGVIGSSIAYHAARAGLSVRLVDDAPELRAPAASWASAGGVRAQNRDAREWPLVIRATGRWHDLAEELGEPTGFRPSGHLHVALTESDLGRVRERAARERAAGIDVRTLQGGELPPDLGLGPDVVGGTYTPRDGAADPRRTTRAFRAAAVRRGASWIVGETRLERVAGRVHVTIDGRSLTGGMVVIAAGGRSAALLSSLQLTTGLVPRASQMLKLTAPARRLRPTVTAEGESLSVKQLGDGALLVGGGWRADVNESGTACRLLDESVAGSRTVAARVLPWSAELAQQGAWCGIDSQAADGVPHIGHAPIADLYVAVGFSNHGFQLAPAVGEAVAHELTGIPASSLEPLRPRFGD